MKTLWTGTDDSLSNAGNQLCAHILERILRESEGMVALGSNKISKRSPQFCNESNMGVIPKALGN